MVSDFPGDSKIKYELNNSDFWSQRGDDFFNQQEYDKAIKCYDESISLNPSNPDAWNKKGISLLKLGMVEEAIFCRSQLNSIISVKATDIKNQSGKYEETFIQPEIKSVSNILNSPTLKPFDPFAERKKKGLEDVYKNS